MDTRMIVFALLCVTGLVLVTGQIYDGRGGVGRGGGGGGGGPGGGGGHGPGGCGPVCAISCEHGNVPDGNGCPTCRCNPPPLITCPRNGKWNGIRCTPWLPNTGCELGVSCETTTSGKGICCSYPPPPISACSGNGIPIGRTCSLGRPECGPGASCETTSSGSGICCRYPLPPPISACSGNGIPIGRTCSIGRPECGPGASCETTSSGSGICCRYPLPEIQCPPGTKRTAQTCSPMSPNNNQCSSGANDFCQGGPADGGVCCRPTVRPGTCPPPSSMAGACVIGPNQCRYDNQCGVNQKCCSEGCGRVCKYVRNQYPPIPPIPTY